jgi:hypothetical protein
LPPLPLLLNDTYVLSLPSERAEEHEPENPVLVTPDPTLVSVDGERT